MVPLPWIFLARRVFTFSIGSTESAGLIGALSAENAEFSQDNRNSACKRAHQGLDFGGGPGLEILS
jgi:hypothetical protein